MGRLLLAMSLGLAVSYAAPQEQQLPERNPFTSLEDVSVGREFYLGHCAGCHGHDGQGGRGVDLTTGNYRHAQTDRELLVVIQKGIPGTEMPRSRLPILDLWKLTAYVRGLARAGVSETVSGDSAAGAEVYTRQQCSQCHVIDSKGGALGPELTRVGLRRPLVFLREALVEPDKYVPRQYKSASAVDRVGQQIRGVMVNQDDFTIKLRDAKDALYSFAK